MEKVAAIIIVTYVRLNSVLEGFACGKGMMRHGKPDSLQQPKATFSGKVLLIHQHGWACPVSVWGSVFFLPE